MSFSRSYTPQPVRLLHGGQPGVTRSISAVASNGIPRTFSVVNPAPVQNAFPLVIQAREVDLLREKVSELQAENTHLQEVQSKLRASEDEVRGLQIRVEELTQLVGDSVSQLSVKEQECQGLYQETLRLHTRGRPTSVIKEVQVPVVTEVATTRTVVTTQTSLVELGKECTCHLGPTRQGQSSTKGVNNSNSNSNSNSSSSGQGWGQYAAPTPVCYVPAHADFGGAGEAGGQGKDSVGDRHEAWCVYGRGENGTRYPVRVGGVDGATHGRLVALEAMEQAGRMDVATAVEQAETRAGAAERRVEQLQGEVKALQRRVEAQSSSEQQLVKEKARREEAEAGAQQAQIELQARNARIVALGQRLHLLEAREAFVHARETALQTEATRGFAPTQPATVADLRVRLAQCEADLALRDQQLALLQQQLHYHLSGAANSATGLLNLAAGAANAANAPNAAPTARDADHLQQKDAEIAQLRDMNRANYAELTKVVEENRALNNALQIVQTELRSVSVGAMVQARDERIAVLEHKIAIQAEEFATREAALRNAAQMQNVALKDEQILVLQKKYTLAQQELEVAVRSKTSEHASLHAKIESLNQQVSDLNAKISEIDKDNQEYKIKMADYRNKIKEVETLEKVIEEQSKEKEDLLKRLKDVYNTIVSPTKVVVETVEGSISEQTFADVVAQLKHAETEIATRDAENHALRMQLSTMSSTNAASIRVEERIVPVETPILTYALQAATQEMVALQRQKDSEISHYRSRVKTLVHEVSAQRNTINTLEEELAQYKRIAESDRKENTDLRKSIMVLDTQAKQQLQARVSYGPIVTSVPQATAIQMAAPRSLVSTSPSPSFVAPARPMGSRSYTLSNTAQQPVFRAHPSPVQVVGKPPLAAQGQVQQVFVPTGSK